MYIACTLAAGCPNHQLALPPQVQAIYVGPSAPRVTAIKAVGPTAGAEGTAAATAPGGSWGAVHGEMAVDFSFSWNSQMEGEAAAGHWG